MGYTEMGLPIDIPWKRIGVSRDMIDQDYTDYEFPQKWISSIALFYHEPKPEELPPDYCDRTITYLKIVCTLSSYQMPIIEKWGGLKEKEDISVLKEMGEKHAEYYAYKTFERRMTDAYPCYGALLQIGVHPNPKDGIEIQDYPYVSAYEPKKREMYEIVSQSGEMLSQSASNANVTKGTTSTHTTEKYDIDYGGASRGGSGGLGFGLLTGSGQSTDASKKDGWTTIDSKQKQDVKTTDTSREKRESYSHSTNIENMYSLLQSFHLGTNRVLFFMQPRPHIQDAKFTFLRGLRRLEGIQEFFLVVNRPKSTPGLCIEVVLETAHLYAKRAYSPRFETETTAKLPENLHKTAEAIGDEGVDLHSLFSYEFEILGLWNNLASAWKRQLALSYVHQQGFPGWAYIQEQLIDKEPRWTMDKFSKVIAAGYRVPNITCGERMGLLFDEYESGSGDMFVTGRRLCSCFDNVAGSEGEDSQDTHISSCEQGPSITFETDTDLWFFGGPIIPFVFQPYIIQIQPFLAYNPSLFNNSVISKINGILWSSIGSKDRYPLGKISLLQTKFATKELAKVVKSFSNKLNLELKAISTTKPYSDAGLDGKINTIEELTNSTTSDIAKNLEIEEKTEAMKTHNKILVKTLLALDTDSVTGKRLNPVLTGYADDVKTFYKEIQIDTRKENQAEEEKTDT